MIADSYKYKNPDANRDAFFLNERVLITLQRSARLAWGPCSPVYTYNTPEVQY